jgi:hypothetical protein
MLDQEVYGFGTVSLEALVTSIQFTSFIRSPSLDRAGCYFLTGMFGLYFAPAAHI